MEQLLAYLNAIHPLSPELKNHFYAILKVKEVLKKEYLLEAGNVCRHIYFVNRGLVKCFHVKDGHEVCTWFMPEGNVIASIESFFQQVPSYEWIQALEDSELYYVSWNDLQDVYQHFPEFNFTGRVLSEKYYVLAEQRVYSMRMQRSHERYDYMFRNHPNLLQRVSSKDIASYLGITEETLSRIRGKGFPVAV